MKLPLLLLLLLVCVAAASARQFERCEWARVLQQNGMDGYQGVSLANCEYCHWHINTAINIAYCD